MSRYVRARDDVQVSEEEALTASGALKDGYRYSTGHMTRDRAPPDGNSVFMRDASHINDAIAQIPHDYRTKVLYILGELQSDSACVRDSAIRNGHSIAAYLKQVGDGHVSAPLMTDSCRPMCARVADIIYAHIDVARNKDSNGTGTPTQLGDAQAEYQRMRERDSQAWKGAR